MNATAHPQLRAAQIEPPPSSKVEFVAVLAEPAAMGGVVWAGVSDETPEAGTVVEFFEVT